jgi:Zn-dependent peptidase ImmA (M78 family)
MPKQSMMIRVNSKALRESIIKRQSLASLETPLGVSRQAINGWLSKNRIPPRKLSILASELDFSVDEMEAITTSPKDEAFVLFRTNRNVAVSQGVKEDVLEVAEDFFSLDDLTAINRESIDIVLKNEDPTSAAKSILKQLNLSYDNISLDKVLTALKRYNVHILFYNFGEKFVDAKAQAVCVRRGNKRVIFVNSYEFVEDVLWRIFHEVCHLFSNHTDVTEEDEKFCNEVANQILTPDAFFQENKSILKRRFSQGLRLTPFLVEEIATELSSSFQGVVIALKNNKIIDDTVSRYLWGVIRNQKKTKKRVHQIISPSDEIDPKEFLDNLLEDSDRAKFVHLQQSVKMGLILDKISTRRAAELLHIDEMSIQQLARRWKSQYGKKNNL